MQVLVLAGGLSAERDVSLRSGRRVAEALRTARPDWQVLERDVDATLLAELAADAPDCVVPLLHGSAGEDGAVRDVLECLGLPYVGSRAAASRLAFDKPVAKTLVRRAGVATPEAVALPHATFRELGAPGVMAARSDLIIDAEGTPWFLEVNVAPGMTETSLVPQALAAAGLDMGAQMAALVERAIARV